MVKKIFYRLILTLPVLIGLPVGAAQAATLYVSNAGNNTIEQFDTSGTPMVFATVTGPFGLAFDAAGNLYVALRSTRTIRRFSPTGVDLGNFATIGLGVINGLAFDATGNLYVANFAEASGINTVRRFSPTGADLGNFATGLSDPTGLAFDATGNLYVANSLLGNNTIRRFSPTGADLGIFATVTGPFGLAFDAAGNLYSTSGDPSGNNTIRRFSPTGVDLGNFATTGLSSPVSLAFDAAGNLYVANLLNNTVRRFSPTGVDLGNFATIGLSEPASIAFGPFGPIPEPSTLVLLGAGLVGLFTLHLGLAKMPNYTKYTRRFHNG